MTSLTSRQVLLIVGCVFAIATAVMGAYGLVRGPAAAPDAESSPRSPSPRHIEVSISPREPTEDRALPHTDDAVDYSRAVASSLFNWDTAVGLLPTDYAAVVLADADPSGEEAPGLVSDVATYLPTTEQWLDLGSMEVAQSLTIDRAAVPASWRTAVEQAHGHLRPGTTAVTIHGTRQRSGVWNGKPAAATYPVSFTIFVACPPAFDRCRVLRLSELDNPLR